MFDVIEIQNAFGVDETFIEPLLEAVKTTLAAVGANQDASLTILLTDNEEIQELNRKFRNEDQATDVLSFPMGEPIPGDEALQNYLGDLVISVPFAEQQAMLKGHLLIQELQLLAAHGTLHLLDFDHTDIDQKERMWTVQKLVLEMLGLANIQPSEDEHNG
jgi:probable rRNA maturation factor